jgi:hypothetical protein
MLTKSSFFPKLFFFVSLQILSYTRGTKALIRNATASDYYEGTSVSGTDSRPEKRSNHRSDKKSSNSKEAEKRVTHVFLSKTTGKDLL